MNKKYTSVVMLLGALAACGGSNYGKSASPTTAGGTSSTAFPTAGARIVVKTASSRLGQILVDQQGNTLYAFTKDTDAKPTCTGACATAWPPAIVTTAWSVAPGLDSAVFRAVDSSGQRQVTAGKFPLYRFSGDARPGDVNGQGSGGVWFVVDSKANLIRAGATTPTTTVAPTPTTAPPTTVAPKPAAPAAVSIVDNKLGRILAGPDGRTLYGFLQDANGTSTCVGACAKAWPPVIVDASLDLSKLPNAQLFSIIDRPDGTKQLKAGKWPLYYFSGDGGAGDTNGQGSGGMWFVVGQDAKLIK